MKPAEEYILKQPELYREIILNLQLIIEKEIPDLQLFFKWKVPYYFLYNLPFCYIISNQKKGYVDLGFAKGFQLKNIRNIYIQKIETL
jgi:hypothetical protein